MTCASVAAAHLVFLDTVTRYIEGARGRTRCDGVIGRGQKNFVGKRLTWLRRVILMSDRCLGRGCACRHTLLGVGFRGITK